MKNAYKWFSQVCISPKGNNVSAYTNIYMYAHLFLYMYMVILRYINPLLGTDYTKYATGYVVKAVFSFVINLFTQNLQFI